MIKMGPPEADQPIQRAEKMSAEFSYPKFWSGHKKSLIITHAHPDPDAIGCSVGMFYFLQKFGLDTNIFIKDGLPQNLRFISQGIDIQSSVQTLNLDNYDLLVILDCGSIQMTEIPELENIRGDKKLVNIDHHPTNDNYGGVNIVQPEYAATSEIVYKILEQENFAFSPFVTTALLAGIFGDTGSFRHSNTTARTLQIAGELMSKGARLNTVAKHLRGHKSPEQVKGWSYVFEKARYDEKNNALIAAVTYRDIKQMSLDDEAFEGVIEILNTVPEAKFAAFLRQQGDKVKVSLRSENYKDFAVNEFAQRFGGGGHKLAAGFSVPGTLKEEDGVWYIEPS